jgi:hypothetical protein
MYPQQTNEELCSSERDVNFGIGAKISVSTKESGIGKEIVMLEESVKILCSNIENLRQRLIPITNESVNDCENNRKEEEIPNTPLGNSIRKISDTVRSEILLVKNIISLLEI